MRYCAYYKPSKDETLACRGFVEVQFLLGKGVQVSFRDRSGAVAAGTVEALLGKMCTACPFFRDDCDFILKGAEAPPCGGFLLLGQLVDDGTISVDDIGEMG
jgi:hypothetical protein